MVEIDKAKELFEKEFIIRQARPYDWYDMCQLSVPVSKRDKNDIDWEHSYIGISKFDGRLAWGYILSTDREGPEELGGEYGLDAIPVEFIDIFAVKDIPYASDALQYHFLIYGGKIGNAIYFWKFYDGEPDEKTLLFNKLLISLENENTKSGIRYLYWASVYDGWGGKVWERYRFRGK